MAIETFAGACEAMRCIDALDKIETGIVARAKNDLSNLAQIYPDISGVAESIIGSITDAVGDSGLHSMKRELQEAIEKWERKAA